MRNTQMKMKSIWEKSINLQIAKADIIDDLFCTSV